MTKHLVLTKYEYEQLRQDLGHKLAPGFSKQHYFRVLAAKYGLSVSYIAQLFYGMKPMLAYDRLEKQQQRDDEIVQAYLFCHNKSQVAREFGLSPSSIIRILKERNSK